MLISGHPAATAPWRRDGGAGAVGGAFQEAVDGVDGSCVSFLWAGKEGFDKT